MVETKQKNVQVMKQGDKLIIPEGMTYPEAREWITRQEQAEESVVAINDFVDCFPLDGVVALQRAFSHKYGFTALGMIDGWFGPKPPPIIQVPLANGTFESAPLGKIEPPKWEGGYLMANVGNGPQVVISGQLKRKFEPEVKEVIALTRKFLHEQSIYRGQAIMVDLHWYGEDAESFHPINDAPKFMDISETRIILNKTTEFELATSVYMILERADACKNNGIKLKHGALFKGPFGTGKTMCAKVLARKGTQNGWTFIYLKRASQLANGLRLAKMYAPAVVFAEDVDTEVSDRDEGMNDLLNTLDGVDTKDAPIMVVLTTNKAEDIDPSFLRAGRMDTVIHFGEPDAETAIEFVKQFAGDMLKPGEDLTKVGQALDGLVPAFITEAVSKAKRYTIYRTAESDITGLMEADDIIRASTSVRDHLKMMQPKGLPKEHQVANKLREIDHYSRTGELIQLEATGNGGGN